MRILVVGGTGVLAPAAAALVARGDEVTVLSRGDRPAPEGADALIADARDPSELGEALGTPGTPTWDHAIAYAPALTEESLRLLAGRVRGRLVMVRTSGSADPELETGLDPDDLPADTLLLGWTSDRTVGWHGPERISRAALEVLDRGVSGVLGALRPWSDRPR